MEMKTAVVPYSCMEDLRAEFAEFAKRDDLNGFQRSLLTERYNLNPKTDFEPKSIVICALPLTRFHAVFFEDGKRYESVVDKGESTEAILAEISRGNDWHYYNDFWIPVKRLATRSGLCEYGRNNIVYAGEYGSLLLLAVFISDMPCPEEYTWRPMANMAACEGCDMCQRACPTGAILPERFLIDNERCLSFWNEWGTEPFPKWIPADVHHRMSDCSICQQVCPQNQPRADQFGPDVEFSEEETRLLLSGAKFEELPEETRRKAAECRLNEMWPSVPRNLRAIIEATKLRRA